MKIFGLRREIFLTVIYNRLNSVFTKPSPSIRVKIVQP